MAFIFESLIPRARSMMFPKHAGCWYVPINVIKRYTQPKCRKAVSWQELGFRKSLEDKEFLNYIKLIRDTSYRVMEKEN